MQILEGTAQNLLNTIARPYAGTHVYQMTLNLEPGDLLKVEASEEFSNPSLTDDPGVVTVLSLFADPVSTPWNPVTPEITQLGGTSATNDPADIHHITMSNFGDLIWTSPAAHVYLNYDVFWNSDMGSPGVIESPTFGSQGAMTVEIDRVGLDSIYQISTPPGNGHLVAQVGPNTYLQSPNGSISSWDSLTSTTTLLGNPGSDWHVKTVAQDPGDGLTDLLMQHDDGEVWEWRLADNQIATSEFLGAPGSSWDLTSAAGQWDPGRLDILLQHDTQGTVWEWGLSAGQLVSSNFVGNPGADWSIVNSSGSTVSLVSSNPTSSTNHAAPWWSWVMGANAQIVSSTQELTS